MILTRYHDTPLLTFPLKEEGAHSLPLGAELERGCFFIYHVHLDCLLVGFPPSDTAPRVNLVWSLLYYPHRGKAKLSRSHGTGLDIV